MWGYRYWGHGYWSPLYWGGNYFSDHPDLSYVREYEIEVKTDNDDMLADIVEASKGEHVRIIFSIKDGDGNTVDLNNATANYRIGKRLGAEHLFEKNSGSGSAITIGDGVVAVVFSVDDIPADGWRYPATLIGQLFISKHGSGIYAARHKITINDIVL